MVQDSAVTPASTEDDERAKVHRAQGVPQRTSASTGRVCLIILTVLAVLYTLYFAAAIILPFVLALVLALVLEPAMRLLNRRLHIPRMIAALLLIIALFSVVGAMGYALSVPASGWIAKAPQSLPVLADKLRFLERPIQLMEHGVRQLQNFDVTDWRRAGRAGCGAFEAGNAADRDGAAIPGCARQPGGHRILGSARWPRRPG